MSTWSFTQRAARTMLWLFPGFAALALTCGANAGEPCVAQWDVDLGQPGMDQPVQALTIYNGDLIVGGEFATAGGVTVNNIARWDGAAWHPLASGGEIGMNFTVHALTVFDGDLIAGGGFTTAGGQTVNRIARWDGAAWQPLTSGGEIGVSSHVYALTIYNGDLVAAGNFFSAGGQAVSMIARWDGAAWHPFASGGQSGFGSGSPVWALEVHNGELFAGGDFLTAGGQTVNRIARWDGAAWLPLTSGGQIGVENIVFSLGAFDGNLIVGGFFNTAGGQTVNHIARWDGDEWSPFVAGGQIGLSAIVDDLMVYQGNLIAGGRFATGGGVTLNSIARWNGTAWHTLEACGASGVSHSSAPVVLALAEYNGDLVAGGRFDAAGVEMSSHIAIWHGCPFRGACCIDGVAVQLFADECAAVGGVFHGREVSSEQVECDAATSCLSDVVTSKTFQPPPDGMVDGADLAFLLGEWGACE